ncbi:KaiC/GvpD/RAD55 family RecA-like ATPase [Bradyrhizobium sp. GM6.1]
MDTLLGGGLERGTNALLIGAAGVGKSSIALTYAIAAAERGEHAVIFAFDEGQGTTKARAKTLGLPLADAIESGRIRIEQIDPAELAPGARAQGRRDRQSPNHNNRQLERLSQVDARRAVSYSSDARTAPAIWSQLGVLTILVLAQHGLVGPMDTPLDISYLSDAVLMLRYFEYDGSVRRALSIVKNRSGNHEHAIREFRLSEEGVKLGPPLKGFSGILTGTPVYRGEEAPLLSDGDGLEASAEGLDRRPLSK